MKMKKKRKRNPLRFYLAFAATITVLTGLQALCHFDVPPYKQLAAAPQEVQEVIDIESEEVFTDEKTSENDDVPMTDTLLQQEIAVPSPLRRHSRMWSYQECFPDSQATQLSAALLNGITPTQSREELITMLERHQLVDISQSPFYSVDELQHSMPYLVPKAQQLLNTIAINFIDSLHRKGLPPHKPIITSVLRTTDDVSRLQKGNKNATTNSCHCYGTTIDITYHRFQPIGPNFHQLTRYDDDLKFVLAEVLYDLRLRKRCYVKYEYKQACFHLTVR